MVQCSKPGHISDQTTSNPPKFWMLLISDKVQAIINFLPSHFKHLYLPYIVSVVPSIVMSEFELKFSPKIVRPN